MNGDEETIDMLAFIRLFTLPGEPQEPVTLEGKAWDEERGMAIPSGEMMTWTPRHPPQPVRQIVPGINPPPIKGDLQVSTVWDRDQKRCVFNFYRPQEAIEPEFIVDEKGVRPLLPDVEEMSSLHLVDEEKLVLLEEAQACHLTWPVSLKQVETWAERMGYELAGQDETDSSDEMRERLTEGGAADQKLNREERETHKKSFLQERAIMGEIKRRKLDPHDLRWYPGKKGDKQLIQEAMLKDSSLFTDKSFQKAWESLSSKGQIRNTRREPLSP